MRKTISRVIMLAILLTMTSKAYTNNIETFSLTVKVDELRNSKGVVQFALYNKDGTIPDEDYKSYFKIQNGAINEGSSSTVFENLPEGRYAVNVLHDENMNGKVDKGFVLPIEGVGFTNYNSIGLTNRPNFIKASFDLTSSVIKSVKINYF